MEKRPEEGKEKERVKHGKREANKITKQTQGKREL